MTTRPVRRTAAGELEFVPLQRRLPVPNVLLEVRYCRVPLSDAPPCFLQLRFGRPALLRSYVKHFSEGLPPAGADRFVFLELDFPKLFWTTCDVCKHLRLGRLTNTPPSVETAGRV